MTLMSRSPHPDRLARRFWPVWSGQTCSAIGSEISGMGTAVYVFVTTGSSIWLGVLTALATLPRVLTVPFMTWVDRWPRKATMMGADALAALGPVTLLAAVAVDDVAVWHLAVAAVLSGTGSAFQAPAAQAAVPLLAGPGALARANGLMQLGPAIGIVVGPAVAAPLVARWGLAPVIAIDLITFAVAVTTVAVTRFPEPVRERASAPVDHRWRPALAWLNGPGRPLRTLLCVGALVNAALALFNLGILTLATHLGGPERAGLPVGAVGVAIVLGSLVVGARGVAADRVATFAVGLAATAVGCTIVAVGAHLAFVVVGGVVAVALIPAMNAALATVFQERVPAEMQGRVFGLRGAIGGALYPIAAAVGGVLIDEVGAPLMDGPLAGSVGALIGTGADRGAALVVLACGAALGAIAVWLARSGIRPALRAPGADAAGA